MWSQHTSPRRPVDRLKALAEKMCSYGLARKSTNEDEIRHGITPRDLEFLAAYFKMNGFLEEFGESLPTG